MNLNQFIYWIKLYCDEESLRRTQVLSKAEHCPQEENKGIWFTVCWGNFEFESQKNKK